jgi:hypothetical protein
MPTGDGWYLVGPVIAVALVGILGTVLWRTGCVVGREDSDGLSIFGDLDDDDSLFPAVLEPSLDYGLLCPAAVTDRPEVAAEIRTLLGDAGIRSTRAVSREGRITVLVFREELERARRLVL